VPRLDGNDLRSRELQSATIRVLNVNLPASKEPDMCVHAEIGPGHCFHVSRPAESRRVDHALDSGGPGPGDIELNATDLAVLCCANRGE